MLQHHTGLFRIPMPNQSFRHGMYSRFERPAVCLFIAVATMALELGFILVPFSRTAARILVRAT